MMLSLSFDMEMKEQSTIETSSSSLSQNFSFLSEYTHLDASEKSRKLSLKEAVMKKEEKVMARSRSTMKLMKRNLQKEAYLEQLHAAIDYAKEKLRGVGSQISASHVSTMHITQLIDVVENVAEANDVDEKMDMRREDEGIIGRFKIEEGKHEKQCREHISNVLSSWRMENKASRLLDRLPPADLFERKVASIVARLERREQALEVSEKEVNEELETLLQREGELDEELNDISRVIVNVGVDIEVKTQKVNIFEEHASKNRQRKVELEKKIDCVERDVNSIQKQLDKDTSLLAELMHKKGNFEAQLSKYDMLIKSYVSKINETRRENERLQSEIAGKGNENGMMANRCAIEKELNEVGITIGGFKEELAILEASLGDDRQKSASEIKAELGELKDARVEATRELAEIRRLIAEYKDRLLIVDKNAEAVNIELERSRLTTQRRLVQELRKKRDALKAATADSPKGSLAFYPGDTGTPPASGFVRLRSPVRSVDVTEGAEGSTKLEAELTSPRKENSSNELVPPSPVKAAISQPVTTNRHAQKSDMKLVRSDTVEGSSLMSLKLIDANDLYTRIHSWIQHHTMW